MIAHEKKQDAFMVITKRRNKHRKEDNMYTIDTIIRHQVRLFNRTSIIFEEFQDREVFTAYLAVYVIDENQNKLIVMIPFDGGEPSIAPLGKRTK